MKNALSLILFSLSTLQIYTQVVPDKPNFIFIVIDDLNDYIGAYGGHPQVTTPAIDEIAEQGITFLNAFANASGCAPSRTSFLSGKDMAYTKVLNNEDYITQFRNNFTAAEGNEEVYTLPEILKDEGGYYTYAVDKIFHSAFQNDYDKVTPNPCAKHYSWNKMISIEQTEEFEETTHQYRDFGYFEYGMIPDSLEHYMQDVIATDTAIQFINRVGNGTANTCGKPFFLALGYNRPHSERFIPKKYYLPYFVNDIYETPYIIPYNQPDNAYPYNGIVLAPQPDPIYNDYYSFPEDGIARAMADVGNVYNQVYDVIYDLPYLPEINPLLTNDQRIEIIAQTASANYLSNYIAAVHFMDAQIGRLMDALNAQPAVKENTIIILVSDHGYSLGEKRHWSKWSLWETDLRIPFIIVDPSKPGNQICNNVASLIDLYPTILDMADVDYPLFADGSRYLDGNSLMPILNNPAAEVDNIALTTTKKNLGLGSCFPHYSVRNEQFHYIRYQSNNGGAVGENYCDSIEIFYEEELYDIGVNRETDPNEWNNLAYNEDYAPLKNFMNQFLPGEALYLQNPLSVQISTKTLPCFLNDHTAIKLNTLLFSNEGNLISGAALTNYQFKWTNNLTAAVFTGKTYTFNTSTISPAVFAANNKIMFYLEVTDLTSGNLVAFKMHEISINSANTPSSSFNVVTDPVLNSADIVSYSISGSYTNTYWTFGDGNSSEEFIPDTHFYATPGPYSIRNYIEYGNGCLKSKAKNITITREGIADLSFKIYPNPVDDKLNIIFDEPLSEVTIQLIDILGKVVFEQKYYSPQVSIQINTNQLIPGNYVITINAGEIAGNKILEIVR